jgi:hypothetical protein
MKSSALYCVFMFAVSGTVFGDPPGAKSPLTEADQKAIAWFDTLGFPDLAKKKCVRVATGMWSQSGNDSPVNRYVLAFLLSEKGDEFTVFTPDLITQDYRRTKPGTPEHERVDYGPVDLKKAAEAQLAQLRMPTDKNDPWRRFGERLSERGEVFVLARVCAANGLEGLAHELICEAAKMPDRHDGKGPPDLIKALSDEIAYNRMWRAVLDCGEPSVPRRELVERFHQIAKHFPTSEYAARANETAELYAQMVKEDEEHDRKGVRLLDKMPTKERVAELIYELRDQNGQQWSQPGSCDIFFDPRGEKSPAHQLVAIGFDAVPQLIDAVDDRRFTRSVGFHRNFYFSHHVLRVGDCAEAILERIAGRSFYTRTYTNAAMVKDGQESETKKEIRKWWKEVQTKGEKQVLIEAVAAGDQNAVYQAQQLLKKYPHAALGPIVAAVKKQTNDNLRTELIAAVCEIPGEESTKFLLEEMQKGPCGSSRVSAASGLFQRGHAEAVPAMIGMWESASIESRSTERPNDDGTDALIEFLAQSNMPAAIDSLAKHMGQHGVDRRIAIISAFGSSHMLSVMSSGLGGGLRTGESGPAQKAEVEKAVERLLVAALDDAEAREGMSGSWDGKSFQDPRVCDFAGHILAQRLPKKYVFDLSAPLGEREQQRLAMINVWRTEQKLPPRRLPKAKRIAPAPAATTAPLLAKVVEANSVDERTTAISAIEKLGLAALPAVRQRAANLDAKHAARSDLAALAARLASTVDEIIFTEQSVAPSDALRRRLLEAKGKPLNGKAYVAELLAAAGNLPAGAKGARLWAVRNGDDTGVTLRVELTRKSAGGGVFIAGGGWETSESVTLGSKVILGSSGGSSLDSGMSAENHSQLVGAVDQAVAAPPESPFLIRASMTKMP